MSITRNEKRNPSGDLLQVVEHDDVALTTTVTDAEGAVTVEPIAPDILASLQASEREENQLARIDQALTDLKAYNRLTRGDYNLGPNDPVDLRPLVDRINDLVKLNRDLIRLVRGLAAEDET